MQLTTSAAAALLALVLAELLGRAALRRRTAQLFGRVLDTADDVVHVILPRSLVLPLLVRGRVRRVDVTAGSAALPTLRLDDVHMTLEDLRLDMRLLPSGGTGRLIGSVPAAEIARQAGIPGRLSLEGGSATLRWMGLPLRFRPELRGRRIRLSPTPFTMTLPPLPPGTTIIDVEAGAQRMTITAEIDLATLFTRHPT